MSKNRDGVLISQFDVLGVQKHRSLVVIDTKGLFAEHNPYSTPDCAMDLWNLSVSAAAECHGKATAKRIRSKSKNNNANLTLLKVCASPIIIRYSTKVINVIPHLYS